MTRDLWLEGHAYSRPIAGLLLSDGSSLHLDLSRAIVD